MNYGRKNLNTRILHIKFMSYPLWTYLSIYLQNHLNNYLFTRIIEVILRAECVIGLIYRINIAVQHG